MKLTQPESYRVRIIKTIVDPSGTASKTVLSYKHVFKIIQKALKCKLKQVTQDACNE